MNLQFLGTGTSTGVPQVKCNCVVCRSSDSRDKRLRSSVLVNYKRHNILIDCGPDFRDQILRCDSPDLHALLLTHTHYDHTGGIDDLRPYCAHFNRFPIYCRSDVARDLRNRIPYCFTEHPYPGVPTFNIHEIDSALFHIDDIPVLPLPIMHYRLPIIGFKIGNLAYITDAKEVPQSTIDKIRGIDTLIINALRITEHMSHMNLAQALQVVNAVNPRIAYFTHMSHGIGLHSHTSNSLPTNVHLAYDGLSITIPDAE